MKTASRRWTTWVVVASAMAHLGVVAVVLQQRPTLPPPPDFAGPPQAIIPVLILPPARPPVGGKGVRLAPIQLHRRRSFATPGPSPVAPVAIARPRLAETPVQAPGLVTAREASPPPAADAVRAALRTTLGCTDQRLSRDDRTACLERLGRGARDAPYLGQPLSGEKRAAFDQAGAAKLAARAALEGPIPPPGPPPPTDYSGDPYFSGAGVSILGPVTLPPSKRAAAKLGPLPP